MAAEVRLKWVIDTEGAAQAIDELTGKTYELTQAEKEHVEQLTQARKQMEDAARAANAGSQSGPKNGFGGRKPPASGLGAAAMLGLQADIDAKDKALQDEIQHRTRYARQADGIVGRTNDRDALEKEMKSRGLDLQGQPLAKGRSGGMLGRLGAAGVIAQMANSGLQSWDKQESSIYGDNSKIPKDIVKGIWGIGPAVVAAREMATGQATMRKDYEMKNIEDDLRLRTKFQTQHLDFSEKIEMGRHIENRTAAMNLDLKPFGNFDRGTVRGENEFRERSMTIGAEDNLARATSKRGASVERLASVEADYAEARKASADAEQQARIREQQVIVHERNHGKDFAYAGVSHNANVAREEATIARKLEDQKRDATKEARLGAEQAKSAEREAVIQQKQSTLDVLGDREGKAKSQAINLAGMGPMGRMQGQFALQMLEQHGVDFASPEIIGQARSYAPEKVSEMLQGAGEKFRTEARGFAPEEYKYDLKNTREEGNKLREEMRGLTVENERTTAKAIVDALMPLIGEATANLAKNLKAEVQNRIGEEMQRKALE
jgi:hypothetical protein